LRWFAPRLIELARPNALAFHVIPVRDADPVFPRLHPLVSFNQQWLRFSISLLSSQARAQPEFRLTGKSIAQTFPCSISSPNGGKGRP